MASETGMGLAKLLGCFRRIKREKVLAIDFLLKGSPEASSPVPA